MNLVEWLKMMVGSRRTEEVVDPVLHVKPAARALKRILLVALRCVDPESNKRPNMGQVVRMLEADEVSLNLQKHLHLVFSFISRHSLRNLMCIAFSSLKGSKKPMEPCRKNGD